MPDTKPIEQEQEEEPEEPLVEPLDKSSPSSETENDKDNGHPPKRPSDEELGDLVRDQELREEFGTLDQLRGIIDRFIDTRSVIFLGETHIRGDFVARDQYRGGTAVSTDDAPFATEHVFARELAKVRAVYVCPPNYDRAESVITNQRFLILQGRPHIGKWTTALHLGAEALQAESVVEVDPGVPLGEMLKQKDLRERTCYVAETLAPDSAQELSSFLINQLKKELNKRGSHLILCADADVSLSLEASENYLIEWNEIPPAAQVLESHLRFYIADPGVLEAAQELAQSDRVQAILSQHLLPRELDRLAELLSLVARGESTLDKALAQFEARAENQVRNWFDSHEDPDLMALMIALAVFNGARYQDVVAAQKDLLKHAVPQDTQKAEVPAVSAFASRRRRRLEEVHAHLEQVYEQREYGRSQVETIAFDNPAFQPAVLGFVWDEFDALRSPLLQWLLSFGQAPFYLRARAATAAGELAKHDFVTVLDSVVRPWANSNIGRARDAAALTLGILAWSADRAGEVRGLLNHWASLRNNWRLRWTAASAYGSLAGLRFPDLALRNLFTIVADGDSRLFGVVSRSVAFLFDAGEAAPEFFHKVLKTLAVWTEHKRRLTRQVSLLIFLDLAGLRESTDSPGDQEETWPWLLRLSHDEDELRTVTTTILRRTLSEKVTRRPALDTLYGWLKQAGGDMTLESAITGILRGIATNGDERERNRLLYYLNGWAHDNVSPLPAAVQVLHEINTDLTR